MNIVFMGTTYFSNVVLNQLLEDGFNVVGVVTQPDRPFGRKKELKAPLTKELAIQHQIPVLQPESIKNSIDEVLALKPDCIVTCAYGQIVPKGILDYPKYKSLNVHASLLPKHRGGAPIHKSIIAGDTETGVTLMFMDVGMDSGDMLAKEKVSIEKDDTFGDVEAKLMEASKILIHKYLPLYLDGKIEAEKQNKDDVTYAYAIKREEEFVSFKQDADIVYNHIRGLIPWPTSYGVLDGLNIKIHGAKKLDEIHNHALGTIVDINTDGVLVAVENGYILLTSVQPAGKPKMSNQDIVNGYKTLWKGKVFE
ncbi:MAG: methionyl-tRNA formyltransferase [Erysipelothrix sp.]|nr:methionyl-tRNA formyltransferase [Erysipelothrix sp.]